MLFEWRRARHGHVDSDESMIILVKLRQIPDILSPYKDT